MVRVHTLEIDPPIANASCAWASDYDQLRELYDSPHIGAVTTRTATLDGYVESEANKVRHHMRSTATTELTSARKGRLHVVFNHHSQLLRLFAPSPAFVRGMG